jgi:diguanylate cyclase (GGDEF)-like protein/PAS domain S-box-containing protein
MNSTFRFRANRLPAWAGTFVAIICIAFLVLSGACEWSNRNAELKNAEVDVANLAQALAQHADDTFELVDLLLTGMVNRLQLDGTGSAAIVNLQTFMNLRKNSLGRVRGLFVYDERGRWVATTADVNMRGLDNSDRDYFRHHMQTDDRRMLIGRPVKSRSGGQWIITGSRRFNHSDGSFAGVALATIDVAYFSQFFSKFNLGKMGAATLLSADGIVLARNPDDGTYVGRDLSSSPLFRERTSHPQSSSYYFRSPLDGMERLSFYKASDQYPVMVLATKAKPEVLAGWRVDAAVRMSVVVALLLVISIIGFYLVKQLRGRERLEAELVAREADFRLLAEESSDMVTRIGMDGTIQYVSPSSARVVGWQPDQLMTTPALAGVHGDDLPRVEQLVATLKGGEAQEARIIYRTRHRDKKEVWIESTMRVTRDFTSGRIDGVVAVSRDMTEHKSLEHKLAALAIQDGLTGIANRRHFDERLEVEWARARREGSSLSLLLIDVDHFKKYNDHYGHQAGDVCLRSLAGVLAEQARRPADLAARYGGEEFVLLLPDTDAEGCRQVGEKIRSALAELDVKHELNLPSHKVTVSIGGATRLRTSQSGSSSLVEDADRALYAAKDTGRDRLVLSAAVLKLELNAFG